jgi:membrane-associated protease RseP (regulator of RpoE activity)
MLNYAYLLVFVFIAGTFLLSFTKYQRFSGILFMIRTEKFISLIDSIAKLSPRLWNFLADLSIVFSFGGLGATYLSDYRKDGRNLGYIYVFSSLLVILLWGLDVLLLLSSRGLTVGLMLLAAAFIILAYISLSVLPKIRNKYADFIFSSILFTLVFIRLGEIILGALGTSVTIPTYISIVEGAFGIPPLLFGMFALQAYQILFQGSTMPGVSPMLPSVQEGEVGISVPGYPIFIPIIYALISFFVLLVSHEFAHGVLARVSKIKIKSVGIATLGIIPIGAFVEPDETELNNKPSIEKMRVFSAGSFANLLVCIASIALMLGMSLLLVSPDGVKVYSVAENGTAVGIMEEGMIIHTVNDLEVSSISSYKDILNVTPGKPITFGTDSGTYTVIPKEEPVGSGKGYIGIVVINSIKGNFGLDLGLLDFIWAALGYLIFFNFNVALVNILPVAPFDGWRMMTEILSVFGISQETTKKVVYTIVAFGIMLLFINALPLFGMII